MKEGQQGGVRTMKSTMTLRRGRKVLHRTWTVVTHLVDDIEPDRISTIAPIAADGSRVKPFSQN
jgi:transcription elongation GreA/GreB family factor